MDKIIKRNKRFLTNLFGGTFHGHAIIMDHEFVPFAPELGDYTISQRPVKEWLPWVEANYAARLKCLEALDDDSVPYVNLAGGTTTGVFAAAFGCPIHVFGDSPACALPAVTTAEEADRLPLPDHHKVPALARVFELAHLARERLGPEVPIGVPDIQSAFDTAALVWKKEDFFAALYENPGAVQRLVEKCHILLTNFLQDFKTEFPGCNLLHCPNAWVPPELGCSLSEDEVGSLSPEMFVEFCLPSLTDLSRNFGGLFMHCCANADHQYENFKKIPNLRGINRVFQEAGPRPALEAFSGQTVFMVAWTDEKGIYDLLDMALPDTRFLFDMGAQPIEEAKKTYERLRSRCPRI